MSLLLAPQEYDTSLPGCRNEQITCSSVASPAFRCSGFVLMHAASMEHSCPISMSPGDLRRSRNSLLAHIDP